DLHHDHDRASDRRALQRELSLRVGVRGHERIAGGWRAALVAADSGGERLQPRIARVVGNVNEGIVERVKPSRIVDSAGERGGRARRAAGDRSANTRATALAWLRWIAAAGLRRRARATAREQTTAPVGLGSARSRREIRARLRLARFGATFTG